jgi:hypothetical protein
MKRSLRVPLVVSAIVPFLFAVAWAQNEAPKADKANAADKADAKPAKQRAKPRGRLPAYYNQVVDGQQREKIYAIQQQYEPKITALKAELQALQDKLDAEVEGVLTAEQRDKVKSLTEAAKQKRKGATASATASATTESSTDDASEKESGEDSAGDTDAGPQPTPAGKSKK